jgi:osmotically-inducible protein OsmY
MTFQQNPDAARSVSHTASRSTVAWRRMRVLAVVVAIATQLQGCLPIIAGGIVAGTYAATDRRSIGAQADDRVIGVRVPGQIEKELGDSAHVNVSVFNRKVLMTGEVESQAAKEQAGRIANGVENVTGVVNELAVAASTSFTARSSDAFITSQVKARLVNEKDIYGNAFKVVTERGSVYLMGRVTQREGDYAANVAREVGGVLAVIKVFDYISEDELRQMNTQAAPS